MKPWTSVFLTLALVACRSGSPEAQIQGAFKACVKAVETSDPDRIMDVLSPDFAGPEGMKRDEARLYLMGILQQQKIGITVLSNRLQVKGARAEQNVELLITGRSGSSLLPQDSTRRLFLLRWERKEKQWRLVELQENP